MSGTAEQSGTPWRSATWEHHFVDRVSFGLRSGDLRVERHDWVHYVTWVPRGEKLTGPWGDVPGEENGRGVND